MFTEDFLYDGRRFSDFKTLAQYLKTNFRKSLNLINDGTLFGLIGQEDEALYKKLKDLVKDFEYKENILTLTLYMMDNSCGIVTPKYTFNLNRDIAKVMKMNYPTVVEDIKVLFRDKVLAYVYWHEYELTNDSRYKRNYTFMLHVYENRMYDFTYYYYLFLNLDPTESIRFTLDGVKMRKTSEISTHLMNNPRRAIQIIDEILANPFILALIAVEAGIDEVSKALNSHNHLNILIPLSKFENANFIPITKQTMAYWLLSNYQNYNYETEEAKALLVEYGKLQTKTELNNIADYIAISEKASELYSRFISLFNHNRLATYKHGITAQDDYYLAYRYNDDYVCKQFLVDNNLFDYDIHTPAYELNVEKELLVDELEIEKAHIGEFKKEVKELTLNKKFDLKYLRHRKFLASFYFVLIAATLILGIFAGLYNFEGLFDVNSESFVLHAIKLGMVSLSGLALFFDFIAIMVYNKKVKEAFLVNNAINSANNSLKAIDEEEQNIVLAEPGKNKFETLMHLDEYRLNREEDLKKIKLICNKKQKNGNFLLVTIAILISLPIIFVLNNFIAITLNKEVLGIYFDETLNFNFAYVIYAVVNMVLVLVLRKKNFSYYFIILMLLISSLLTVLL